MKNLETKISIRLFVFALFSIFISSCTDTELKIELPTPQKKFVVQSTFTSFTPPLAKKLSVFISQNEAVFDSLKVTQITDATIKLFIDGQFLHELIYDSITGYRTDIFPEEGKEYSISIEKKGFETATAKGSIPPKVGIKSCKLSPVAGIGEENLALSEISVTFDDPINQSNYYEIMVWEYEQEKNKYPLFTDDKIITLESYYPSPVLMDLPQPNRLLFSDKQINGKTHTVSLRYYPPQILMPPDHVYISPHLDFLLFRSVSKDYYLYYTTMLKQINNNRPDLLYGIAEPSPVYSNIQNGYGVFAGYSEDNRIFTVDSLKVR